MEKLKIELKTYDVDGMDWVITDWCMDLLRGKLPPKSKKLIIEALYEFMCEKTDNIGLVLDYIDFCEEDYQDNYSSGPNDYYYWSQDIPTTKELKEELRREWNDYLTYRATCSMVCTIALKLYEERRKTKIIILTEEQSNG